MSRKKNLHQKQILLPARNERRAIVAIVILLSIALVGGLIAHSREMRAATGIHGEAATTAVIEPQASPSPSPILSKEYIYAGSRLLATEVPLLQADVTPAPNGDGKVTVTDWVKIGRFAAGLDTPTAGSEFQRGDCSPRTTLGNGAISLSDWVQAGRYAAGLDPPTWKPSTQASIGPGFAAADGPVFALALPSRALFPIFAKTLHLTTLLNGATGRIVRIVSPTFVAGQNGTVIVQLDSLGNENALGLSLSFNPAQLTYVSAVKGSDATDATLNKNSIAASSGRVGIALSLSSGATFAVGTRQMVVLTFTASASGALVVSSGNQPAWREVADVNGNTLVATFTP